MKAAVVHGVNDIRIEEYPSPVVGAGEVIVKTKIAGICATDIKTLLGQGIPKDLPTILGHEVVGEIAATGDGVKRFENYVFLSGCADNQTSAELIVNDEEEGRIAHGAMTYSFVETINRAGLICPVWTVVHNKMIETIRNMGLEQTPQLNGNEVLLSKSPFSII